MGVEEERNRGVSDRSQAGLEAWTPGHGRKAASARAVSYI
jgi:hypothetical protein